MTTKAYKTKDFEMRFLIPGTQQITPTELYLELSEAWVDRD